MTFERWMLESFLMLPITVQVLIGLIVIICVGMIGLMAYDDFGPNSPPM